MESINSQPLEDMLEAQPVSILRVVLASIFGFIFFIVGTFFSVLNHLGVIWLVFLVITIPSFIIYAVAKGNKTRKRAIKKFAEANNLTPLDVVSAGNILPKSLRGRGWHQRFENCYLIKVKQHSIPVFDYLYDVVGGKSYRTQRYSAAVIKSQKTYAHFYLAGKASMGDNKFSSWTRLDLEGNFNEYFRLYTEDNHQVESLEFLTPDVMQLLMDKASLFDIEVDGSNITLITSGTSVYYKSNMDRLVMCLDAILSKITPAD